MKVYMAGAVQNADENGRGWRDDLSRRYTLVDWLNPLDNLEDGESYDEAREKTGDWNIVSRDLDMIDEADVLLAYWTDDVNCGTPMEVFYAYTSGTPVVVVFAGAGSPSPWLTVHSDTICRTFSGAMFQIKDIVRFK